MRHLFDKIHFLIYTARCCDIVIITKCKKFLIEILSCELKILSFNFGVITKKYEKDIFVFNFGSKFLRMHFLHNHTVRDFSRHKSIQIELSDYAKTNRFKPSLRIFIEFW